MALRYEAQYHVGVARRQTEVKQIYTATVGQQGNDSPAKLNIAFDGQWPQWMRRNIAWAWGGSLTGALS
jgi:hypothetical protein